MLTQTTPTANPGLLGAPLPSGYAPSDFATLDPVVERRGPCDALALAPATWVAQARIEVSAPSAYARRQRAYEALIDACDLADSD